MALLRLVHKPIRKHVYMNRRSILSCILIYFRQFYDYMQVVVGDQATCKTIRASKLWRQTEIRSIDTLKWVNETPGK